MDKADYRWNTNNEGEIAFTLEASIISIMDGEISYQNKIQQLVSELQSMSTTGVDAD
jgi:hypothetical protein